MSIVADRGTVMKNGDGSFLVLEDGNLQRFEIDKRDPALVAFARYAFDMSKFSNQGHDVAFGIRERYLWELLSPAEDDPLYSQIPGQFRAELHDRFMAPLYPFAFAALTFAFLGSAAHHPPEPQLLDRQLPSSPSSRCAWRDSPAP